MLKVLKNLPLCLSLCVQIKLISESVKSGVGNEIHNPHPVKPCLALLVSEKACACGPWLGALDRGQWHMNRRKCPCRPTLASL